MISTCLPDSMHESSGATKAGNNEPFNEYITMVVFRHSLVFKPGARQPVAGECLVS